MKILSRLRMSLSCFFCLALTSCAMFEPSTSDLGTGSHRCYYQNSRTGQFYLGVAPEKIDAQREAKASCAKAAQDDADKMRCTFAECRFK